MRLRDILLTSICTLAFVASASAQTTYTTTLNGLNEVGPNASPATGTCTVVLNAAQTQVSISCQFQNLIGTYTASHLHAPAPITGNAGVIIGFVAPGAPWVFSNANHDGTLTNFLAAITAANVTNLNNGLCYANVHSTQFPGGEIRGQMASQPTATAKTSWSRVKALFR